MLESDEKTPGMSLDRAGTAGGGQPLEMHFRGQRPVTRDISHADAFIVASAGNGTGAQWGAGGC